MNGRIFPSTTTIFWIWSCILHSAESASLETRLASEILDLKLLPNPGRPILIQNAIPQSERRQWWKHIQTRSKDEKLLVDNQAVDVNEKDEEEGRPVEYCLQSALEMVQANIAQENGDPIYVESIGSSCSTDQLPIYEYCQSFFDDSDILSNFSPYTPIHEQLIISCNQARSTVASRCYTTTCVCIGGSPIEYRMEPTSKQTIESYKATRAMSRTWEGDGFHVGWNSLEDRLWSSENQGNEILSASVLPGDILVIPRGWWFQSQAQIGAANISVLGKRCGSAEFERLVQDILPLEFSNKMLLTLASASLDHCDDGKKYQMLFDGIKLQNRG